MYQRFPPLAANQLIFHAISRRKSWNGYWIVAAPNMSQPVKSNLQMYKEFNPPGTAEITDGKFITILGWGTVLGHSLLPDGKKFSMDIWDVLYIPEVSKQLFSLITARHKNNISKTTRWGTIVSQNGIPFIIGSLHGNKLHYFNLELMNHQLRSQMWQ